MTDIENSSLFRPENYIPIIPILPNIQPPSRHKPYIKINNELFKQPFDINTSMYTHNYAKEYKENKIKSPIHSTKSNAAVLISNVPKFMNLDEFNSTKKRTKETNLNYLFELFPSFEYHKLVPQKANLEGEKLKNNLDDQFGPIAKELLVRDGRRISTDFESNEDDDNELESGELEGEEEEEDNLTNILDKQETQRREKREAQRHEKAETEIISDISTPDIFTPDVSTPDIRTAKKLKTNQIFPEKLLFTEPKKSRKKTSTNVIEDIVTKTLKNHPTPTVTPEKTLDSDIDEDEFVDAKEDEDLKVGDIELTEEQLKIYHSKILKSKTPKDEIFYEILKLFDENGYKTDRDELKGFSEKNPIDFSLYQDYLERLGSVNKKTKKISVYKTRDSFKKTIRARLERLGLLLKSNK